MEAKEKAIELVEKFTDIENKYKEYTDFIQAKQCAIIAVDEIINNYPIEYDTDYWQEVKSELLNLK